MSQIELSTDDFMADLSKLGRANGNILQRLPGVPGVHDGQVMIRLNRLRYVILDYSIQPNDMDRQVAAGHERMKIPKNAGTAICVKAGVSPMDLVSCFHVRNSHTFVHFLAVWNRSDIVSTIFWVENLERNKCQKIGVPLCLYDSEPNERDPLYIRSGLCFQCQRTLNVQRRAEKRKGSKTDRSHEEFEPSLLYAFGPCNKKFKLNGGTIHLKNDAIIINGAIDGLRHGEKESATKNYSFREIGSDLIKLVHEAAQETTWLVTAASGNTSTTTARDSDPAATVVAAVPADPYSIEDVNALYFKAFQSINRSVFLLSQWKSSWEMTMASTNLTETDSSLNDAMASAAALVATAMSTGYTQEGQEPIPSMVSLLLAANKSNDMEVGVVDADYDDTDRNFQSVHAV
jgi:hypothetical protein